MRKQAAAVALGLAAALAAPGRVAASSDPAAPAIVNGLLTSDFPTTGALLSGGDPGSAIAWCSGTLVGCQTFLTAAHCVCATNGASCQSGPGAPHPGNWLVFLQHAGFFAVESIAVHPDFAFPVGDVAVLRLAAPVGGIAPTPIAASAAPPVGTPGTIAGFGRAGGSSYDYGLKRYGDVVTASCTGGISSATSVCWDFASPVGSPGTDSNTCNADSGGPLFVDLGAGEVVAGVTSGGSSSSCLPLDHSYDANVFFYASWIEAQAGPDLASASCGPLPPVGGAGAQVHGFAGSVSAPDPEGRHELVVPAGAVLLRVAMNASEEGSNDFDLYVKAGSPPTTSSFDCAATGSNQWGFCELTSPAAGSWHVLVRRSKGSGTYQATATVFPAGCANGIDDDGDALVDAGDPGCADGADLSEDAPTLACDDGVDQDGDGRADYRADGLGDPGCRDDLSPREDPHCDDDRDNDGDGGIDWDGDPEARGAGPGPADSHCVGRPWLDAEASRRCGLGFELGVLLPALLGLRVRRERRVTRPQGRGAPASSAPRSATRG